MNKEFVKKHWYLFNLSGSVLLIAAILILRAAEEDSLLLAVGAALSAVSGVLFVLGIFGAAQQSRVVDERFIIHRLKATRFALILGLIAIGIILVYDGIQNSAIRYDLLIVVGVVAVGKLGGIAWFKLRQ